MKNTDKLQGTIIFLLIITLVGGFVGYIQINNQIQQLKRSQQIMESSIGSISGNVQASIQSMQEAELNKVSSFNYDYLDYDTDTSRIETNFEVTLKEKQPESKVFLVIKEADLGSEVRIPLSNEGTLTFMGSNSLDINTNYTIDIIEETQDGGMTILNYNPLYASVHDELSQNRLFDMGSGGKIEKGQKSDNITFAVNSFGVEAFAVDKILLYIQHLDETIDIIDITNDTFTAKSLEELDEIVVAASPEPLSPEERPFFGEINSESVFDKYGNTLQLGDQKRDFTFYMYTFNLDYMKASNQYGITEVEARGLVAEYHVIYKNGSEEVLGMYY